MSFASRELFFVRRHQSILVWAAHYTTIADANLAARELRERFGIRVDVVLHQNVVINFSPTGSASFCAWPYS